MKSFAVIFTYNFDSDVAVYLFDTYEEAHKFAEDSYYEEMRIDREENGWDTSGGIIDDVEWVITNNFPDHTDITKIRIGNVYR